MKHHAFLSYSHRDMDMMRRIRADLNAAGLNIWTDESLIPGTHSWKNAIEDAIQNALSLVVLLSPDAKHSDWIEKEMDYARACGLRIIPVLIRGEDEISAVPFELINVQRIDMRADYAAGMQKLITSIESETPAGAVPQGPATQHHLTADIEELNPISIYDHVRLFIWLFWMPAKLARYREQHGDENLRRTAAWLVADFAWIGFLAPAIGMVLGTVQVATSDATINTAMQALSGVVFLAGWFVTGWFGWRDRPAYAMVLLVGIALVLTLLFSSVAQFAGMILSEQAGMTRFAFLLLTGIMLSTAAGIAFRLSTVAAASVAGILLGSLIFNAFFGVTLHLDGGIAAFIMFVTAILIAWVVDNSLVHGTTTPWHRLAFAIIMGAGALMIVLYFLGGWIALLNVTPPRFLV